MRGTESSWLADRRGVFSKIKLNQQLKVREVKDMTIKELYEDAVSKGKENYDIELQYQDSGGAYSGSATLTEIEYRDNYREVLLV